MPIVQVVVLTDETTDPSTTHTTPVQNGFQKIEICLKKNLPGRRYFNVFNSSSNS